MATTKYEVLCRYYNVDMKMPIINDATETWVSCFDESEVSSKGYIKETFEFCTKKDTMQEKKIQDLLIKGNNSQNPKFNMFFMYKARDFMYSDKTTGEFPYMLIDCMERMPLSPWFVHSTHVSLNSAMAKIRALANVIGHENVKLGKVVALDQFVEIV